MQRQPLEFLEQLQARGVKVSTVAISMHPSDQQEHSQIPWVCRSFVKWKKVRSKEPVFIITSHDYDHCKDSSRSPKDMFCSLYTIPNETGRSTSGCASHGWCRRYRPCGARVETIGSSGIGLATFERNKGSTLYCHHVLWSFVPNQAIPVAIPPVILRLKLYFL